MIRTMFVRHIQPHLMQQIDTMHSQNTELNQHSVMRKPPQSPQSLRKNCIYLE